VGSGAGAEPRPAARFTPPGRLAQLGERQLDKLSLLKAIRKSTAQIRAAMRISEFRSRLGLPLLPIFPVPSFGIRSEKEVGCE
jgi:hypothetical protein